MAQNESSAPQIYPAAYEITTPPSAHHSRGGRCGVPLEQPNFEGMENMSLTKYSEKWLSIRNTRWVDSDNQSISGAKLAQRLMQIGLASDVHAAIDLIFNVPRKSSLATGVSGYTRVW